MSKSAQTPGKPGKPGLLPALVTAHTGTFCPFKQPVTQDPIAAGVVLASILPLLETYGQSLAEPRSPFLERKCPMGKCNSMFKTPWSFINHLLLCSETSSGDVSCQKCQPSHVEKTQMSPVRQALRRLSGARKRNHNGASSLDFPDAKRGRVEDVESLQMGDDLLSLDMFSGPQEFSEDDLAELDATGELLEAMAADYDDRMLSNSPGTQVAWRPLQQSWCDQPPAELAAGPVPPRQAAELYGTPRYSSASHLSRTALSQTPQRDPPAHPWSPLGFTSPYDASPVETHVQKQKTHELSMHKEPPSHYTQQFQDESFGLDPRLNGVSGGSLAPSLDGRGSFRTGGVDDDAQWFSGTEYSQLGQVPAQTQNTGALMRPTGYMASPSAAAAAARLSVVTQPTPAHLHAYGQQSGAWTPTKAQLDTPVSTVSAPSATSTDSGRWGVFSSVSSAWTGHTSASATSPTKSATTIGSEASGGFRRPTLASSPGTTKGTWEPGAAGIFSPGTESIGHWEVCPYAACGFKPKRRKNWNTHMERHIKTHQPDQGIACEFPGCDRVIAGGRTDNLRQHMIKAHDQVEIPSARGKHVTVPSKSSWEGPQTTPLGYGDGRQGSWATGHVEVHERGSRRGLTMLTGLVSGVETQFDGQQTPGGLGTVVEDDDDLDLYVAGDRPPDIGPTAWNSASWI